MEKGSEEPFRQESGTGSSNPTNDAIPPLHPSIREYIFNLTEEEWKDFISMIDCQMARNQFVEMCQAVLKVVSSSSMNVILPVFSHMERNLEHSSNTCPRCKSAGSSTSAQMSGRPASQGRMFRMRGSLAALWKTMMAWRLSRASTVATTALRSFMADHPPDSAKHKTSDLSEVDSMAQHGGQCCDPASIKGMVDRVLSSEGLDGMARHLVDEMQGILQQSSPFVTPLASGRSTPISQPPQMVYSYAEGAMGDLLKPLLPFLVAHSAPLDGPGLRRADSPATDGVDEVPVDSMAQHGGQCCDPASIKEMVDRVLSSEGLDGMARHLVDEMQDILQQSSPFVTPSASGRSTPIPQPPQMVYSYAEGAMGDLLKPLLPFLVAHSASLDRPRLRRADSPVTDAIDEVSATVTAENMDTASSHSKDQSERRPASCEPDLTQQDCSRRSMISVFTNLMVHELMIMLQKDAAAAKQERSNDQKYEDLIDKVMSTFGGASGAPNMHEHLNNIKIQTIYRIMDGLLLQEFGSEAIQQRAGNPEVGFGNIFLTKLRELFRNSADVTDVPPSAQRASSSIGPVHASAGDKKQKAGRFSRFRLKAPKRRSTKVSPIANCDMAGKHAETPAPTENISDAPADGPKAGKRSWFMRMFSCCLQSPTLA
ncbi:uncharacterized protein LOC134467361 isoform X1 [Engraulis encrasicolus]|uniref:uncharacterized protein LOC134467361 isoform X1 n=1 Tax=Engraulis encrasicolus TaxID=184585 RepID=UPI002FD4D49A